MRDFTTKSAPAASDMFQFSLDKVPFTCTFRTDSDAVMTWSEMADAADETELNTAAGAAFISRYFKLMMDGTEYRRFRVFLAEKRPDPDIFAEIIPMINEEMEAAVARVSERPTGPRSSSSAGRGDQAARTSQIISLEDGEVEWSDPVPLPTRAARRNRQRQVQRRRRTA